jgi:galactose mutarotase-like enzyme
MTARSGIWPNRAASRKIDVSDWIEIASGGLTAAINPLGAELSSLRDARGNELMTDADPAVWAGRAPLLFPIVGRLNGDVYRLDGETYAMPKHGFARTRAFTLEAHEAERAVFRLQDDAETRAIYPFAFALTAEYWIEGGSLMIEVTATNRGDNDMPASFGFHPAFAWPLPFGQPRDAHRVSFSSAETAPLRAIGPDGLIAADTRPSPLTYDRHLALADDLFAQDALVWDSIVSESVTYGAGHSPVLEIAFPDTPMLGIWTKPGASFICVEPWHGIADPAGFDGEIWDKPGIMRIAPGDERVFRMSVTQID